MNGPESINLTANGRERLVEAAFVLLQSLLRVGLEAEDECRLGVGGADQSPAVGKAYADAIDVGDLVARAKVLQRGGDRPELDGVGAIDADLGGGVDRWEVGEQLVDPHAGARQQVEQTAGGIDG